MRPKPFRYSSVKNYFKSLNWLSSEQKFLFRVFAYKTAKKISSSFKKLRMRKIHFKYARSISQVMLNDNDSININFSKFFITSWTTMCNKNKTIQLFMIMFMTQPWNDELFHSSVSVPSIDYQPTDGIANINLICAASLFVL